MNPRSFASSQTGSRGHDVRHASITSAYGRALGPIHSRRSRIRLSTVSATGIYEDNRHRAALAAITRVHFIAVSGAWAGLPLWSSEPVKGESAPAASRPLPWLGAGEGHQRLKSWWGFLGGCGSDTSDLFIGAWSRCSPRASPWATSRKVLRQVVWPLRASGRCPSGALRGR
jgi:hypothetical protein